MQYPLIDQGNDPYVDDVFSKIFPAHIPNYEARPQQVKLSKAIDAALRFRKNLLAEGPTGTGKSFAYLIPAIRIARHRGLKVVICTANIALQEQLVYSDLPRLQKLLPFDFKFALMKGRNNYFCRSRAEDDAHSNDPLVDDDLLAQMEIVMEWAGKTSTGDMSELEIIPSSQVWSRVCGSTTDCDGGRCRETQCYSQLARQQAQESDVIVCNYHVLFADVQIRMATDHGIIPNYNYLICDEGHEMAEIARDFFGFRFGMWKLRALARHIRKRGNPQLAQDLGTLGQVYFTALHSYAKSSRYKSRIREQGVCEQPAKQLMTLLSNRVMAFIRDCRREVDVEDKREQRRINSMEKSVELSVGYISDVLELANKDNVVYYIDAQHNSAELCSKLIDVSSLLKSEVFDRVESSVIASATLTTGGTFDFIKRQLGLPEALEVQVESPFDYSTQALMVVPRMENDPTHPNYPVEVAERIASIIQAAKGRTLCLFTSYRVLNTVVEHLRRGNCEYDLLVQGDMPRTRLVDEFRSNKHSVLLGVSSLWTGVDIQGESLSCLAIDRLPFPNPTDPVMDALTEIDPKWFFTQSIPRAVITFRQGFGRLIRSKNDTGVIVMLDRRVTDKPYGRQFIKSLPDIQFSRDIDHVQEFIEACDLERAEREVVGNAQ